MLLFIYAIITKQQYQNEGHHVQHHREGYQYHMFHPLRNLSL